MKADEERSRFFLLIIGFLLCLPGPCTPAAEASGKTSMQLTSPAFKEGESIPEKHTCDGKDTSPPLVWAGAPAQTKSFVLITDDPDASGGTWNHWVLFDIAAANHELAEDLPKSQYLPGGARQGLNSFKRLGYGGPCPPAGKPHRYFFKLYALNLKLDLKPGVLKQDIERAMAQHIIGEGQLMGTYQRK
jgi:Raf kinase inhibitor-like YbhB/YbcL family protein